MVTRRVASKATRWVVVAQVAMGHLPSKVAMRQWVARGLHLETHKVCMDSRQVLTVRATHNKAATLRDNRADCHQRRDMPTSRRLLRTQ